MTRHYSAKVDDNQSEIVAALRKMGAGVFLVHRLKNFCDLMVVYGGVTVAVEVKDGKKPPSKRKLSDGEDKFMREWTEHGGSWVKIESLEDAQSLINSIRKGMIT